MFTSVLLHVATIWVRGSGRKNLPKQVDFFSALKSGSNWMEEIRINRSVWLIFCFIWHQKNMFLLMAKKTCFWYTQHHMTLGRIKSGEILDSGTFNVENNVLFYTNSYYHLKCTAATPNSLFFSLSWESVSSTLPTTAEKPPNFGGNSMRQVLCQLQLISQFHPLRHKFQPEGTVDYQIHLY